MFCNPKNKNTITAYDVLAFSKFLTFIVYLSTSISTFRTVRLQIQLNIPYPVIQSHPYAVILTTKCIYVFLGWIT